jgi:hypothetical protein
MKKITSFNQLKVGRIYKFLPGIYTEGKLEGRNTYYIKILKKEKPISYTAYIYYSSSDSTWGETGETQVIAYSPDIPYFELTEGELFLELI